MNRKRRRQARVTFRALTLGALAAAGIGSTADPSEGEAETALTLEDVMPKETESYHVVFLMRPQDLPEISDEESERIQIRHLGYLNTLREQGLTVAHGPFLKRVDESRRGMIIFSGSLSEERVRELISEDPWVQIGRLEVESYSWLTPAGSFKSRGGEE